MIQHFRLFQAARRQRRIDSLARHVAEQSIDCVVRLVDGNVRSMNLCEARGYIRARATAELRRTARVVLTRIPEADADWELDIVACAADRVAPMALRRCAAMARQATPAKTLKVAA